MQLATEVGFAPPVLVKSTIYGTEDPELEKLRGIRIVCGLMLTSCVIMYSNVVIY